VLDSKRFDSQLQFDPVKYALEKGLQRKDIFFINLQEKFKDQSKEQKESTIRYNPKKGTVELVPAKRIRSKDQLSLNEIFQSKMVAKYSQRNNINPV
jgi:hypothetical protein